jgi:hypothetical protein
MSEKVLCECFICKKENPELGGKLFTALTVKKHRKKELDWIKSANMQNIDMTHLKNNRNDDYQDFDLIMNELQTNDDNDNNNSNDIMKDDDDYDDDDYDDDDDDDDGDDDDDDDGDDDKDDGGDYDDGDDDSSNSDNDLGDYYMQEYNNYDMQETSFMNDLNNGKF